MRSLLLVVSFLYILNSHAAIYGVDDRKEPYQILNISKLTPAVAMMQSENFYTFNDLQNTYDVDFALSTDPYSNIPLCKDQKFSQQYQGYINCTGFLVAEDIMITAGHCMIYSHSPMPKTIVENETTTMCDNFLWMFGFERKINKSESIKDIPAENIYRCDKVLYAELFSYPLNQQGQLLLPVDPQLGQDFAIIKLDRKVVGREPLKLSTAPVGLMDALSTIGYPMGLPLKHAGGGRAIDVSFTNYVVSDVDVIGGNSGGPLLNKSQEVVGVVVRSFPSEDFIYDQKLNCSRVADCPVLGKGKCTDSDGHPIGSHASRIAPALAKLKELKIL